MKRQIQIEVTDHDNDAVAEDVSILFLMDDMPIGGATALINPDGTVGEIIISADLDGDGRVDSSDDQLMRDLAATFMRIKW
jgi:hypothetical protein